MKILNIPYDIILFLEKLANHKCVCLIDDCDCFLVFQDEVKDLIVQYNRSLNEKEN